MDDYATGRRSQRRVRYNEMLGIAPLLMLFDAGVVFLLGEICVWLLGSFTYRVSILDDPRYDLMIATASVGFPLVMHLLGAYRDESVLSLPRALARNAVAWSTVFVGCLVVTIAFKTSAQYSRAWLGLWFASTLVALLGVQFGYWAATVSRRARGIGRRRVVVIGSGGQARRLIRDLQADPSQPFDLVALFGEVEELDSVRTLGGVADAPAALTGGFAESVDEVWVLQSAGSPEIVQQLYHSAELEIFNIRLVPDVRGFTVPQHEIEYLDSHLLIGVTTDPQRSVEGAAKTCMDYAGAAIGLLLLSPLLLVITLAIRLESPGPVLFRQRRHGKDGRPFVIFKFRTLFEGTSHREGEMLRQVSRDDDRITRVGGVLRKWSLDELPQLFNVLRGEMSLVGPRPHELGMNIDAAERDFRYRLRHRVKPGITGWAQIHGYRGPATTRRDMEQRLEHDLWYIDNWTIWLDIRILLVTVVLGFRHQNAY